MSKLPTTIGKHVVRTVVTAIIIVTISPVLIYMWSGGVDIVYLHPEPGCNPYAQPCRYPEIDINWLRVGIASALGITAYPLTRYVTRILVADE